MKLFIQPTCDSSTYKYIRDYLNSAGDEFEILDKNNLTEIVLGIISVPEKGKMFNGIEPKISFKTKSWGVGLYLDNAIISLNPPFEELDKYIKKCICDRMDELKNQKTLRGIKDRTMLDDIKQLFV